MPIKPLKNIYFVYSKTLIILLTVIFSFKTFWDTVSHKDTIENKQ